MRGRRWGGGGGGDAVFVDVRDDGVVLGQRGEVVGGWARGEVVDVVQCQGADDEGEEEGREEGGVGEGAEEE